jgi:hypothetical protein
VDDMASKELEFRGIKMSHLGTYFEELGAEKKSDSFPFLFKSLSWKAEIISEEIITITSSFHVNAIMIRFTADNDEILEQLIRNYRQKTTRVGG